MTIQCGLQELPKFELVNGAGDYSIGQACVMSAAVACHRLRSGQPLGEATDVMLCCCPLVRAYMIAFNDNFVFVADMFDSTITQQRTECLMPFVPRLAGTRDDNSLGKRSFIIANWLVRTILPIGLEKTGWSDTIVNKFRTLPELIRTADIDEAKRMMALENMSGDAKDELCEMFDAINYELGSIRTHGAACGVAAFGAVARLSESVDKSHRKELLQHCCELADRLIKVTEDKQTPATV